MTQSATFARSQERIFVMQGQVKVSARADTLLTTLLGSCVAACLFDPEAAVGGMNHFLLSEPVSARAAATDEHYGVYLMELLINEMISHGALKSQMKAHLYGGANLHAGMRRIGTANVHFARRFLEREGIPLTHCDLGGTVARRVDFLPERGRARCRDVIDSRSIDRVSFDRSVRTTGDLELF